MQGVLARWCWLSSRLVHQGPSHLLSASQVTRHAATREGRLVRFGNASSLYLVCAGRSAQGQQDIWLQQDLMAHGVAHYQLQLHPAACWSALVQLVSSVLCFSVSVAAYCSPAFAASLAAASAARAAGKAHLACCVVDACRLCHVAPGATAKEEGSFLLLFGAYPANEVMSLC